MADVRVSVVLTTLNEGRNLRHLLDSLVNQENLHEVVLVDAGSEDGTLAIAESYRARFPRMTVLQQRCRRGEGRNIGASHSSGELLAFIDGDCIANAFWLRRLAAAW